MHEVVSWLIATAMNLMTAVVGLVLVALACNMWYGRLYMGLILPAFCRQLPVGDGGREGGKEGGREGGRREGACLPAKHYQVI